MSDLFDTTRVRDEPAHWDMLAQRVAANAARESRGGAFEWLTQSRAGWIAACLLLGVALLAMASAKTRGSEWVPVLAPGDDVGRAMAVSDNPPGIGALLVRTRDGT